MKQNKGIYTHNWRDDQLKRECVCLECGKVIPFSDIEGLSSTCKTNTLDKCEKVKNKHDWKVQGLDNDKYLTCFNCGEVKGYGEETECIDPTPPSDNNVKPEGVGEWVERIVIEYANLSGRESANRAEFRKRVEAIIRNLLKENALQEKAKWKGEVRERLERRIKDIGNSETINGAISALRGGREGIAYGMVCGLDEVLTLIDKL